jgi:hypothetical protein
MPAFAPVAPIQILEALKEERELGNYHLLLTHHVLEYPERFDALFANPMGPYTIIMDNSVVELGDAASDAKVKEACDVLGHSRLRRVYPVLTDVMADGPATIEASAESYGWWLDNDKEELYPLFVVLQGNSWETFTKTADHFLLEPGYARISMVGIPRVLVEHLGSRYRAIQYVRAIRPDMPIHLLGFSDDVTDDIICSKLMGIEGIDSAVPLRYSYSADSESGDDRYTPTSEIPARPKDWFEKGQCDEHVIFNLQQARRWFA